jgi:hypothetical protein
VNPKIETGKNIPIYSEWRVDEAISTFAAVASKSADFGQNFQKSALAHRKFAAKFAAAGIQVKSPFTAKPFTE